MRRLIDISFALFVILFLWWVLLAAWVAVRLSSPGPAIFAQERVGRQGVPFTCYKFRTMHMGTRQAGTHELTAASITRTGAFLRKTKIDELPQIWNLLRNQLSLVGPRPGLPVQTKLTEERMKRGVFEIPPGITGWAQIQNIDMSDPERLARTDAQYVALRSVLLDLKIILATARGKGQGDKVSL
ncbi:lipid carrier : UDP-N-acetylgalactosaminyltransferase [Loktanella sp. 22II-4b]|nr:lipid carrier : UDP-N-acetylgalactosaminyltransferase [Loktanella sp. 22II-4b]